MAEMDDSRESLAQWLTRTLNVPPALDKWPWLMIVAGFGLAVGASFGVNLDLAKGSFEPAKDGPSLAGVGAGLFILILGLVLVGPWIKVDPVEADGPFPDDKTPTPLRWPVFLIGSPQIVYEEALGAAIQHLGRDLTNAEIRWPKSSQRLVDQLRTAQRRVDKIKLNTKAGQNIVREAPGLIPQIQRERERCKGIMPALARRCAALSDGDFMLVIKRFLLLANFEIHRPAALLVASCGAASPGLKLPRSWEPFADGDRLVSKDKSYSLLFEGYGANLGLARLYSIGDVKILDPRGWPAGLGLPQSSARKAIDSRYVICNWLIPQLEFQLGHTDRLPDVYGQSWILSSWRPSFGSGTGLPGNDWGVMNFDIGADDPEAPLAAQDTGGR